MEQPRQIFMFNIFSSKPSPRSELIAPKPLLNVGVTTFYISTTDKNLETFQEWPTGSNRAPQPPTLLFSRGGQRGASAATGGDSPPRAGCSGRRAEGRSGGQFVRLSVRLPGRGGCQPAKLSRNKAKNCLGPAGGGTVPLP